MKMERWFGGGLLNLTIRWSVLLMVQFQRTQRWYQDTPATGTGHLATCLSTGNFDLFSARAKHTINFSLQDRAAAFFNEVNELENCEEREIDG